MSWTRTLTKMIRRMIREALVGLRTHIPCQVVSYDGTENLVVLQPCINVVRRDDPNNLGSLRLPVIEDVPVRLPGSGKCLLEIPVTAGSYGVLHVSDRALEVWLSQGGIVDNNSVKLHDMNDGFFEPGLYPLVTDGDNGALQAAVNTDRIALRTRTNNTFIAVVDDDNIEIETTGDVTITCTGDATVTCNQLSVNGNFTVDA